MTAVGKLRENRDLDGNAVCLACGEVCDMGNVKCPRCGGDWLRRRQPSTKAKVERATKAKGATGKEPTT